MRYTPGSKGKEATKAWGSKGVLFKIVYTCIKKQARKVLQILAQGKAVVQSSWRQGHPCRPLTPPDVRFRIRLFIEYTGVVVLYQAATPDLNDQSAVRIQCDGFRLHPAELQAVQQALIVQFKMGWNVW